MTNFLSKLTGSFAIPASENPTVAMIEAAYRHHNLDWRYINCEVPPERLGDAVRGAKAMGWMGFNCSIPHKIRVIEHLDGLGDSAKIIRAVNTVVRRDDKLIGENTDGKGFVEAIRQLFELDGKSVLIFGAGGAARAISVELALAGVEYITILNRNTDRGQNLVDILNHQTMVKAQFTKWDHRYLVPSNADIVVNATSVGLYPKIEERLYIEQNSLQPHMLAVDCIPNPPRTNFINDAEMCGCTVLDGLGMLVNQGAIAIKYWTGIDANRSVMRQTLKSLLKTD